MKAPLRKTPIAKSRSFECYHLCEPFFDPDWHFHPEYQIFTVLKGSGTRFVGDHVGPFKEGEVVFTGPNLPHLWRSDPEYFHQDDLYTEGIVVYFHPDFLSESFFNRDEALLVKQVFQKAARGLLVKRRQSKQLQKKLEQLNEARDFHSVCLLLEILDDLSLIKEYQLLSSAGYANQLNQTDSARMRAVHAYVLKNFTNKISLDEVAAVASMTPSAFSRHFKRHANKTFSNFLSQIRIGYACKLILENDLSIAQACFECGFQTLSNFNRQFKAITGYNPLKYKRMYSGEHQY